MTTKVVILGLLGLTFVANMASAEPGRIVVLSGQDLKPYQDVIAGLKQSLTKQGIDLNLEIQAVHGEPAKMQAALADLKQRGARLIVTLGSTATQAAVREMSHLPILATMIVSADEIGSAPNATAVLLDFPLEVQLQWLRRFLPGAGTVGMLFNTKENHTKVVAASRTAKTTGLILVPQPVETPRALPDALENITRSVDVLWGISDSIVMTPQTAEPILLSTFRNRIPLVGLSTSWVKAGALYALDRDYVDIGLQCGELAGKMLNGTSARSLAALHPRKVTYAINLKTAGAMNLELPQDLISGAAQVFQ